MNTEGNYMSSEKDLLNWVSLYNAGMMDIGEAMVMTLVAIGKQDELQDFFTRIDGDVSRELRDLVHHVIEEIPNDDVNSWTEGMSDPERIGLQKLVTSAKKFGYRKDDL